MNTNRGRNRTISTVNKYICFECSANNLTAMQKQGCSPGRCLFEKIRRIGIAYQIARESKDRCQVVDVKLAGEFILLGDGMDTVVPLGAGPIDWDAIATEHAQPSSYGEGGECCYNSAIRRAMEIRTFKSTVLATVQCMYPQYRVEAHKINIYRPGSHFALHVDTNRDQLKSTAVLFLTDDFKGGSLDFPKIGNYRFWPVAGK